MREGEFVGTGKPGKSPIPGEYGLSELRTIFNPSGSAVELDSGFHTFIPSDFTGAGLRCPLSRLYLENA